MALPVEHKALEQVRPAQKRRLRWVRAAKHHMVAAPRAGVTAIDHELVGAKPGEARQFVEFRGRFNGLTP